MDDYAVPGFPAFRPASDVGAVANPLWEDTHQCALLDTAVAFLHYRKHLLVGEGAAFALHQPGDFWQHVEEGGLGLPVFRGGFGQLAPLFGKDCCKIAIQQLFLGLDGQLLPLAWGCLDAQLLLLAKGCLDVHGEHHRRTQQFGHGLLFREQEAIFAKNIFYLFLFQGTEAHLGEINPFRLAAACQEDADAWHCRQFSNFLQKPTDFPPDFIEAIQEDDQLRALPLPCLHRFREHAQQFMPGHIHAFRARFETQALKDPGLDIIGMIF